MKLCLVIPFALIATACGGVPFEFVAPLGAAETDSGPIDAGSDRGPGEPPPRPDAMSVADAVPETMPEAAPPLSDAAFVAPDTDAGCTQAPAATAACGSVAVMAPGSYCAFVVVDESNPAAGSTPVVMSTPTECRCASHYTCACLYATGVPWCPPGSHYGAASCGVTANILGLTCQKDDGG